MGCSPSVVAVSVVPSEADGCDGVEEDAVEKGGMSRRRKRFKARPFVERRRLVLAVEGEGSRADAPAVEEGALRLAIVGKREKRRPGWVK